MTPLRPNRNTMPSACTSDGANSGSSATEPKTFFSGMAVLRIA